MAKTGPVAPPRTAQDWERGWQNTWKDLGFVPYELPPDKSRAGEERAFLTEVRSADGERERLRRIDEEFERGFRALAHLAPPSRCSARRGSRRVIATTSWHARSAASWPAPASRL